MKRYLRVDLEYELGDDTISQMSNDVIRVLPAIFKHDTLKVINTRDTSIISELNEPFYSRKDYGSEG